MKRSENLQRNSEFFRKKKILLAGQKCVLGVGVRCVGIPLFKERRLDGERKLMNMSVTLFQIQ